jgi:hypothetical protein
MLLKNLVRQILAENIGYVMEDEEESGAVELDKKMTEKTLDDEFEVTDRGLDYITNVFARLNKKAAKIGVPPITLKVLGTRMEKRHNPKTDEDFLVKLNKIKAEGKSPIIGGYEFIASIEHSQYGNIINISPNSSLKTLPPEYRTASATCDFCHTKRDRNNTYVLRHVDTKEFKRIGRNCLKNFMPDVNPAAILSYGVLLSKLLGAVIGAEDMEDDDGGFDGGGGGGSRNNYYDADRFLDFICLSYILGGKRYISRKVTQAAADAGNTGLTTTSAFAMRLMHLGREDKEYVKEMRPKIDANMPAAEELAKKVDEWKDAKDWDAEIDKKPDMADYFHNMKIISHSPAIQYKNAGYHASLLALYLREKEWGERKAVEKKVAATKSYLGKIGDKMTFNLKLKKDMTFDGAYGTTYMYIFEDAATNEVVYFSSRDLGLTQGETYEIKATVKDHRPSKYNQTPQTIITRGKVIPAPAKDGEEPYVSKDQWGNPTK